MKVTTSISIRGILGPVNYLGADAAVNLVVTLFLCVSTFIVVSFATFVYVRSPKWSRRYSFDYSLPYFKSPQAFMLWITMSVSIILLLCQGLFALANTDYDAAFGIIGLPGPILGLRVLHLIMYTPDELKW